MAARDPNTGQFISSTGQSYDYSDLEQQVVQRGYNTANSDTDQGDLFEVGTSYDIAGGLERGEVAELVAIWYSIEIPAKPDVDDQRQTEAKFELGTHPKPLFEEKKLSMESVSTDDGDVDLKDRDDSLSTADLLIQEHGEVSLPFADFTEGAGGAAGLNQMRGRINYRDWFGRGPMYDRHNTLYEHVQIETRYETSQSVNVWIQMFWLIHDEEDL